MRRGIALVLALLGIAVLLGLGLWQLERRQWKHDLIDRIDAGLAAPPADLAAAPGPEAEWRRVRLTGEWRPEGLVAVAPRTLEGRVGADYAAPFVLEGGDVVVAVLGWAPAGAPLPELPAGPATAEGALTPAGRPNMFMPDNTPPERWRWLEPRAVAAAAGLDPARTSPLALRLAEPPPGLEPRPARPDLTDNHMQYALTWFVLAAGLAGVALLAWRKERAERGPPR